jgi:hypothetical protein
MAENNGTLEHGTNGTAEHGADGGTATATANRIRGRGRAVVGTTAVSPTEMAATVPAPASETAAPVATAAPTSKFSRLYDLASKASRKTFSARRDVDGATVSVRCDGFPVTLTADSIAKLAEEKGTRVSIKVPVGAATGSANGVLVGTAAGDMVRELTTE